jgi:non-ribosomal peptide synthetase component F
MTDSELEPWSYHADGTPMTSLADIIRKRAAATPDGVALSRAGQVTTFAQIDAGSSRAAAALRAAGVVPGERVAFIGASGPAFAEVMYATAKCGGASSPNSPAPPQANSASTPSAPPCNAREGKAKSRSLVSNDRVLRPHPNHLPISSDHFFILLSVPTTFPPEMSEFCGQN